MLIDSTILPIHSPPFESLGSVAKRKKKTNITENVIKKTTGKTTMARRKRTYCNCVGPRYSTPGLAKALWISICASINRVCVCASCTSQMNNDYGLRWRRHGICCCKQLELRWLMAVAAPHERPKSSITLYQCRLRIESSANPLNGSVSAGKNILVFAQLNRRLVINIVANVQISKEIAISNRQRSIDAHFHYQRAIFNLAFLTTSASILFSINSLTQPDSKLLHWGLSMRRHCKRLCIHPRVRLSNMFTMAHIATIYNVQTEEKVSKQTMMTAANTAPYSALCENPFTFLSRYV